MPASFSFISSFSHSNINMWIIQMDILAFAYLGTFLKINCRYKSYASICHKTNLGSAKILETFWM